MQEQQKIAVFEEFLDDEASVLEIARALAREHEADSAALCQTWVTEYALAQARAGVIGFYIDEFGARDTRDCTLEEAQSLLADVAVWSIHSETMLHVYRAD